MVPAVFREGLRESRHRSLYACWHHLAEPAQSRNGSERFCVAEERGANDLWLEF